MLGERAWALLYAYITSLRPCVHVLLLILYLALGLLSDRFNKPEPKQVAVIFGDVADPPVKLFVLG